MHGRLAAGWILRRNCRTFWQTLLRQNLCEGVICLCVGLRLLLLLLHMRLMCEPAAEQPMLKCAGPRSQPAAASSQQQAERPGRPHWQTGCGVLVGPVRLARATWVGSWSGS
jgi:hypothetical protein